MIVGRKWIVVGDLTSSSGRVITGSPFTDIEGAPVARVGDKATCPLHKGIFPIISGDASIVIDGQPVALHGSYLACGCKVLATQQSLVFLDDGGAAAASAPQEIASAPIRFDKPAVCLECLLAGASNGAPLLVRA
ncbi:MAG: PAAR domain-containing protein [Stenotrophomonas sp.]